MNLALKTTTMKDLRDEATLCLIALVEELPQLWCLQNDQYRNNGIKSELWKQIANEMQRRYSQYGPYTEEGVRSFFQNKRRIYRREKEKIMKTKSGQAAEDTYNGRWRFYRSLLFLDRSKPVLSRECNESYQHNDPSGASLRFHGRNGNKRSSGFLRLMARTSSRRRSVQPSCCTVLEWRDNGSTTSWPRRHHLSSSRPLRRKASLRLRVRR
ncbi:uncharacterized protein ISCGN_026528 [Ixodes scapularis]